MAGKNPLRISIGSLLLVAFVAGGSSASMADPPADPNHTLTIQLENDFLSGGSDRYYTNGLRIGYTSPTGQLPDFLKSFGQWLLGPGQPRLAIELSQHIFTPYLNQIPDPPRGDRPYAGVLMLTTTLIQDTDNTRTALGLGIGVIGPAALAREAQDFGHTILGHTRDKGWGTQIPNQPVIQLSAQHTWRTAPLALGALEADVLPSIGVGAGTFRIYAAAGGQVRLGQHLRVDYGAPRLRPGLSGTDAYQAADPVAWYLFLGVDGQAVAWDETLDGLPFGASRHVTRTPFVGEAQGGLSVIVKGWRLTAAHVIRSREFSGQRGGAFQFSSFSLSTKF